VVKVAPATTGALTNTATVSAATADPNPADNTATAQTTVVPAADVSITKTGAPDPVRVGGSLTYTLGVANAGPSQALSTTVVVR
jgi:hypothetical protein